MLGTVFFMEGLFTHSLSLCPGRVQKKLSLQLTTVRNTFVRKPQYPGKAPIIKILSLNSGGMMRFQNDKNLVVTFNCQ